MDDKNKMEGLFVKGSERKEAEGGGDDAMDRERWRKKIKMPDSPISCS